MVIDARNKLKPEDIAQFYTSINSNEVIIYINDIEYTTIKKRTLIDRLLVIEVIDTDEIKCVSNDSVLLITGMDINWWKQNARRYNKLYRAVEETKEVSITTYKVGVATLQEGTLSQIKTFEGDKKAVINFFNEEIRTRYLDEFLKMNIVFNLAYTDGDENDVSQWLSLDELQEMGAITL